MSEKADPGAPSWDAPSGLDLNPRPPRPVRVSKRARAVVIAVAVALLALFAYGGYKRQQRQVAAIAESGMPRGVTPALAAGEDIAKDVPSGNEPTAFSSGTIEPSDDPRQPQAGPSQSALIGQGDRNAVRQGPPAPQSPQLTPEEQRIGAAYEREQQAILAPTTTREGFGTASISGSGVNPPGQASPADAARIASLVQSLARPTAPAGASGDTGDDKEAFLAKTRSAQTDDYLKAIRTAPLSPFEINAGWEIPAVLEQALNSDLPGELKALVTSNVYDTATGRFLLIPQGSRLVGVYNSRIGYGQDGLQAIWDRAIYPDGSSLDLGAMNGQDAHGFAGFRDKVDRHYKRLIGFAVLTSLFAAGSDLSQFQNRSVLAYPSAGQVAGSAVGGEVSDLGAQIARRNLNVPPTVRIPAGYRFNARVNRGILFDGPYEPIETSVR